jgi:hypothetical protein
VIPSFTVDRTSLSNTIAVPVHDFVQRYLTENQVQAGFGYRFDWTAPPLPQPPNIEHATDVWI